MIKSENRQMQKDSTRLKCDYKVITINQLPFHFLLVNMA